jgi:acyl-CoA hydrolase
MIHYVSYEEAAQEVKSGERVFIHGGASTPQGMVVALTNRHSELKNVEITHIHTEGEAVYARPEYSNSFRVNSFFIGSNLRKHIGQLNVQYIPVFLSEIPSLFRKSILPIDTAIVQVSLPDQHGFCSLGVSVDIAKAAVDSAKKIIAVINPNMPRSHGDGQIQWKKFTSVVYSEDAIFEIPETELSQVELAIGKNIASLVEDGATLQLGIGGIPSAVVKFLNNHKNLGIHTEMFNDAIIPLIESGVINGICKKKHPGKIVSTFALGTRRLYDFIHDNPMVAMLDAGYVNDTSVIRRNKKVTAINSAVEIDLTGQVCADSVGSRIISGVGGQMDFIRGAALSEGGKPIIAMASLTSKGISKIVPVLKQGSGVVTSRAHIHFVVTEHGIADLYGKNIVQRAKALIDIAHPDHREELERKAFELFY